jgi:hypothetical protein
VGSPAAGSNQRAVGILSRDSSRRVRGGANRGRGREIRGGLGGRPPIRRLPVRHVSSRKRCVEIPAVVFASVADTRWWFIAPIGVIDATVEGDEILWVVELSSDLLEFPLVGLKSGIQRWVILDSFQLIRIDPRCLVERFVALLESLGSQWLVR